MRRARRRFVDKAAHGLLASKVMRAMIGGQVAEHFGIEHMLRLPIAMMNVGIVLSAACP
jgi:hypothetical protein